jgi:hypothetical protein
MLNHPGQMFRVYHRRVWSLRVLPGPARFSGASPFGSSAITPLSEPLAAWQGFPPSAWALMNPYPARIPSHLPDSVSPLSFIVFRF